MRTRRSWRNQERLHNSITKELQAASDLHNPQALVVSPYPHTVEEIDAMWWLSTREKNQLKRDLVANDHRQKVRRALKKGKI